MGFLRDDSRPALRRDYKPTGNPSGWAGGLTVAWAAFAYALEGQGNDARFVIWFVE